MKKMMNLLVVFLFALGLSTHANDFNLVKAERVVINSQALGELRSVLIHLPESYNSNKNYPVLYLLDGSVHFQHSISAVNYLNKREGLPELIIVAIENVDRVRDFTPTHITARPTSGGGNIFMSFIENELIPHIDKNYNTSPYRVLMGHSLGGLFASYTLLTKPEMFGAYIATSPALMYDSYSVVSLAEQKLGQKFKNQPHFYMTIGNEPNYFNALELFSNSMDSLAKETVVFKYETMPNENHATTPYLSLFNGLRFIFNDWQLPQEIFGKGIDAIDTYYHTLSKKYNFRIKVPEHVLNMLGYTYLQNAKLDDAITVFKENVRRYPKSANVYDSLGDAYETNGQIELAKVNYKKACKLGEEEGSEYLSVFKKNLERVQNK